MEPLFKSKTKYDYKEYKKFNYAIVSRINKMPIKVVVIFLLFLFLAYMYINKSLYASSVMLLAAVIFPFIFYITINSNIKKTYESNKSMKDMDVEFDFYNDYCLYKSSMGENKIEYKDLYKVIETNSNFYLMIAKNQGIILVKSNCNSELQDFLRKLV